MDKFWEHLNLSGEPNEIRHRIYNLLYLDRETEMVKDIRADFENWTIDQLTDALEHIHSHFTLEDSIEIEDLAFGASGLYQSDFFEAGNQREGASFIWNSAAPRIKRKKFF